MDLEKKQETVNINNMTFDNITRYPDCNLISSLKLAYKEGKPIINYYCENNHSGDMLLEEYVKKYNSHSLLKEKCQDCNKDQNEVKGEYIYCYSFNKFLCNPCSLNHSKDGKHNCINFKRYDSVCKIHCNFFSSYCIKCNKNICIDCKLNHESHEFVDLSLEKSKNKIEEIIKNIEKKYKI